MCRTCPFGRSNVKSGRPAPPVSAGAAQLGLLAVVDVLDEAGESQHVLGHPLAPLPARLGVGQRLVQGPCGVGQGRGDLGVTAQRGVDLAEPLGAGLTERGDQLTETSEFAAHLGPNGVEIRPDDVLAGVESGLQAPGRLVEVAAVEHVDLVERRSHGGVALGEVTLAELTDGDSEGAARRRGEDDGDSDDGKEGHGHDGCDGDHVHAKSMTRGCNSAADAGPMNGPSPGYSRNPGEFGTSAPAGRETLGCVSGTGSAGSARRGRRVRTSCSRCRSRSTERDTVRSTPTRRVTKGGGRSAGSHRRTPGTPPTSPGKSFTHPTSMLGTPPPATCTRWRCVCPAV